MKRYDQGLNTVWDFIRLLTERLQGDDRDILMREMGDHKKVFDRLHAAAMRIIKLKVALMRTPLCGYCEERHPGLASTLKEMGREVQNGAVDANRLWVDALKRRLGMVTKTNMPQVLRDMDEPKTPPGY